MKRPKTYNTIVLTVGIIFILLAVTLLSMLMDSFLEHGCNSIMCVATVCLLIVMIIVIVAAIVGIKEYWEK